VRVRETREVSRAASAGEPIRSQGAWCVDVLLLNRGARSRSSTRGSKAVGRRKAHGRSWRSGYGTVFVGARERQRHSEVGSISNGSSRRARSDAARRGGSAPAARSSKVRSRRRHGESVRALFVRGGRGPGGSQSRSASRSTRTEAGDGENPRPLSVSLLRERRAHEPKRRVPGRSRDAEPTRRCTSAPLRLAGDSRGRRPRRDGPRSHLFGSARIYTRMGARRPP
jgi:hypothetical protein